MRGLRAFALRGIAASAVTMRSEPVEPVIESLQTGPIHDPFDDFSRPSSGSRLQSGLDGADDLR